MHNVGCVVPFVFSYSIVGRNARATVLAARRPISGASAGGAAWAGDLVRRGRERKSLPLDLNARS